MAAVAAAICIFVQLRLGSPQTPDEGSWLLVPPAKQDLPPDLLAEAGLPTRPGVLLNRQLQIMARAGRGLAGGGILRFSVVLSEGASVHILFGAHNLQDRAGTVACLRPGV